MLTCMRVNEGPRKTTCSGGATVQGHAATTKLKKKNNEINKPASKFALVPVLYCFPLTHC